MKWYVYILECANGRYYVGSTNSLVYRMRQHHEGLGANFTRKHFPIKLVYYEEYERKDVAYERERQLHGWSRKKKKALIEGNVQELPLLAACQNRTHSKNFDANYKNLLDEGYS